MIQLNVFTLNCLLTFEFFVLLGAVFVWAYTSKNALNKWIRYSAIAIAAIVKLIILCTIVNAFVHCGYRNNCHGMSSGMKKCGMMRGGCSHGNEGKGCCKKGGKMKCYMMMHEKEDMEEEMEEHKGHEGHEEIIKDTVVIKK